MTELHGALRLTYRDDIALMEMIRPKQYNPLSNDLKVAFDEALRTLEKRADLKGVILTGSDGVFSAGGDLKAMHADHQAGTYGGAEDYLTRIRQGHAWLRILRNLPVPVIAAVDGAAVGAGLALALACDLVLITERSKFGAPFCKVGLAPDFGLMYALPRTVGLQRAREMFFTGRTIDAEEAIRIGIGLEIVPHASLMDRAWDMARQMAQSSSAAFSLTKQISAQAMESDAETLLRMEQQAHAILLASRYNAEAAERFTNKEPLRFNFT